MKLSRGTLRKVHQNLWWAVGFDAIAFAIAAAVFYPFALSPEIAALSMSGSSADVAINAQLLMQTKLTRIHKPGRNAPREPPADVAKQTPMKAATPATA